MPSIQKKTVKGIDYWYLIESKRVNGKVKTEVLEYFGNTKKLMQRFADTFSRNDNIRSKSMCVNDHIFAKRTGFFPGNRKCCSNLICYASLIKSGHPS